MLNYRSTSFHDVLDVRGLFGLSRAPEFDRWLHRPGLAEQTFDSRAWQLASGSRRADDRTMKACAAQRSVLSQSCHLSGVFEPSPQC